MEREGGGEGRHKLYYCAYYYIMCDDLMIDSMKNQNIVTSMNLKAIIFFFTNVMVKLNKILNM